MIRLNWIEKSHVYLKWGAIIAAGFSGAQGFMLRWPSTTFTGLRHDLLYTNEVTVWLTVPLLTALAGVLTYFKTHLGGTQVWGTVTHLLEEYKQAVFQGKDGFETDASHHNRVTLYKHVHFRVMFCRWPWTNWVVPVARTGHTTQSWRIPRFRSPTVEPDNAEGVAGVTFAQNSTIIVDRLPCVGKTSKDRLIIKYAKMAYVKHDWVKKKAANDRCLIRSLVGIPIEVKGKPWGAIVIDSRHPDKIIDIESLNQEEFKRLARLLSKLLEN